MTNVGTITGGFAGIDSFGTTTVTSSGTISRGVGIQVNDCANVTNSGTTIGTGGVALQFFGAADTRTLLPGSKIVGAIKLGGGGDRVNFRGGNNNLTFDTLAGATVKGTTPFAVSGNREAMSDASHVISGKGGVRVAF